MGIQDFKIRTTLRIEVGNERGESQSMPVGRLVLGSEDEAGGEQEGNGAEWEEIETALRSIHSREYLGRL